MLEEIKLQLKTALFPVAFFKNEIEFVANKRQLQCIFMALVSAMVALGCYKANYHLDAWICLGPRQKKQYCMGGQIYSLPLSWTSL